MNDDRAAWHGVGFDALHALAEQYGTPFYLYLADVVAQRVARVREALSSRFDVYFAVKANPNLALLKSIRSSVDGLDISSGGELELALAAGYEAKGLSFAGPGKTRDELDRAVRARVGSISVESLHELRQCIDLAASLGTSANVLLRVNPKAANRAFGIKMGGKPVQFGIDEEQLPEALDVVAANPSAVRFHGLHIYVGSQCFDASGVVDAVADSLRIARSVETGSGLRCEVINLGGGFGYAHSPSDREFDLASAAPALAELREQDARMCGRDRRLIFELGRFLVADAGLYVCRIVNTKASRGTTFAIVDGGLNHHLAAAGTFGAALRANFPTVNLSRPLDPPVRCNIAGPSCNPTDLLGVDVEIAEPRIGDLIGVLKSGAYGLSASPILFLGRDTPVELVQSDGRTIVGRPRRSVLDFS